MIKPCVYVLSIKFWDPATRLVPVAFDHGFAALSCPPVHQKEFILVALMFLRLENYFNTRRECIRLVRELFGEVITEIQNLKKK